MKRILLLFIIVTTLLFNMTCSISALNMSGNHTSALINGEYHSFILNEYFANNYNKLFEENYKFFKSTEIYLQNIESVNDAQGYYVMVIIDDSQKSINVSYDVYNSSVLLKISDYYREVIYIGSTTPCAILLIDNKYESAKRLCATDEISGVYEAFGAFFSSVISSDLYTPEQTAVTAADARKVLRVSSGIDIIDVNAKAFYCYFDFNLDDKLNAADARLVLRVAAHIDEMPDFKGGNTSDWVEISNGTARGF